MRTNSLSRAQLRELRSVLESERSRVERSLAAETEGIDVAWHIGPGSEADVERRVGAVLESLAVGRLRAIRDALWRVGTEHYGHCANCGDGIPYGRLLVMPETEYCLSCRVAANAPRRRIVARKLRPHGRRGARTSW